MKNNLYETSYSHIRIFSKSVVTQTIEINTLSYDEVFQFQNEFIINFKRQYSKLEVIS